MKKNEVIQLENPWSGHISTMTWGEIEEWANDNVHMKDRENWLRDATIAAKEGDAKTLGSMIIGS